MIKLLLMLAVTLLSTLLVVPSYARGYDVDYSKSKLTFSGEHIDQKFTGEFKSWHADIDFEPGDIPKGHVIVEIDMSHAETGNAMYDGTLPTSDWFDVKTYPKARFESTEFVNQEGDLIKMKGMLTIKDQSHPITMSFLLEASKEDANVVVARGSTFIDRLIFSIGNGSDANAQWVSKDIQITVELVAKANPNE